MSNARELQKIACDKMENLHVRIDYWINVFVIYLLFISVIFVIITLFNKMYEIFTPFSMFLIMTNTLLLVAVGMLSYFLKRELMKADAHKAIEDYLWADLLDYERKYGGDR